MHNRQTCRSITLRVCSYAYRFQRVESGTAGANMHGRVGCSEFPRCALCLTGALLSLLSVCRYIETFQAGFDEGLKKVPVFFMQASSFQLNRDGCCPCNLCAWHSIPAAPAWLVLFLMLTISLGSASSFLLLKSCPAFFPVCSRMAG